MAPRRLAACGAWLAPTAPADAFSPGGCGGDPSHLVNFDVDLANFLLVRGPYGYLGHGWLACSREYEYPEPLNADYGEPLGLCTEGPAGVFTRAWTRANVTMDCNTQTPSIVPPPPGWPHSGAFNCSVFDCTCSGMADYYGVGADGSGSWGCAPDAAQNWWVHDAQPCEQPGYTCCSAAHYTKKHPPFPGCSASGAAFHGRRPSR